MVVPVLFAGREVVGFFFVLFLAWMSMVFRLTCGERCVSLVCASLYGPMLGVVLLARSCCEPALHRVVFIKYLYK